MNSAVDETAEDYSRGGAWQNPDTHHYAAAFGDRLRMALLASGETRNGWARKLGVSQALVGAWVAGRRLPSAPLMPVMCERLNIDAHWLIGCTRDENTFGDVPPIAPDAGTTNTQNLTAEELDQMGEQLMQSAKECWRMAQARRLRDQDDLHPWLPRRRKPRPLLEERGQAAREATKG